MYYVKVFDKVFCKTFSRQL